METSSLVSTGIRLQGSEVWEFRTASQTIGAGCTARGSADMSCSDDSSIWKVEQRVILSSLTGHCLRTIQVWYSLLVNFQQLRRNLASLQRPVGDLSIVSTSLPSVTLCSSLNNFISLGPSHIIFKIGILIIPHLRTMSWYILRKSQNTDFFYIFFNIYLFSQMLQMFIYFPILFPEPVAC